MTVSAIYAGEHFAELVAAASCGEEVEISVEDRLMLKLVIVSPPPSSQPGRRVLGAGRGELRVPSEEEWSEYKKTLERTMLDAPLLSSGEI